MSEDDSKNDQMLVVCQVEGLEAFRSDKTPVSKISSDMPQWKQDLLRKKEKEKMEKHKAEMTRIYEESQTPEWMKPLKKLHQRRKSEQSEKEEAERRKAEEERQRFEAMPAWKKQLVYKKRAKSAENLLARCDMKNVTKSVHTSSKCKLGEKSESIPGEENNGVNAGNVNGVNDGNEDGILEDEKPNVAHEDVTNDEIETPVDNSEEDTTNDGGSVEDLGENEGEEIKVGVEMDEASVDGDNEQQSRESEENDDDESQEKADSTVEESQIISDDNENEGPCFELDEDKAKEIEEQQAESSNEPTKVENIKEDENRE